jgi:electron transport complex protein RnfC
MENQPCVTADHRLLADRGPEVVGGLAILARAMEARQVVLAVDWRRTGDYQRIVGLARDCQISLVALPHKYPTGADPILVKVLTRRARPPGGSVTDVGVAVTDAATCQAVWRWVACGSPQVGRAVTVAGRWAPQQCNFWVPFGMPCLDLVKGATEPAIHNGPMTGIRCPEGAVVTPATDAVLAVSGLAAAAPTPCIRCAWCTDHCPARLNVAALNDAFELANVDQARKLVALACVECGVCTYVCPARLPLAQRVKQLKRAIGNMDRAMPSYR